MKYKVGDLIGQVESKPSCAIFRIGIITDIMIKGKIPGFQDVKIYWFKTKNQGYYNSEYEGFTKI